MKNYKIFLIIINSFFLLIFSSAYACNLSPQSIHAKEDVAPTTKSEASGTNGGNNSLVDYENKIDSAFIQSLQIDSPQPLVKIIQQLEKNLTKGNKYYWYHYAIYYEAIYYLKKADKEKSSNTIAKAIKSLSDIKNKNSEDYALLAMLQSFSTQFAKGLNAAMVSAQAKKSAEKAIKLNPKNVRAYYVQGMIDFYTPEEFGGKKKTEGFLKKSISHINDATSNAPKWGAVQAYELLIRYYLSQKNTAEAKKYFSEARQKYPGNQLLSRLSKKFQ